MRRAARGLLRATLQVCKLLKRRLEIISGQGGGGGDEILNNILRSGPRRSLHASLAKSLDKCSAEHFLNNFGSPVAGFNQVWPDLVEISERRLEITQESLHGVLLKYFRSVCAETSAAQSTSEDRRRLRRLRLRRRLRLPFDIII